MGYKNLGHKEASKKPKFGPLGDLIRDEPSFYEKYRVKDVDPQTGKLNKPKKSELTKFGKKVHYGEQE